MPICDQFIYTSAKTEKQEGYQVIAKSEGISDDLISDLAGYFYPVGVKLSEFTESRSQLLLKNDKIAYSIVKNIGPGYDARTGTLYNHTFVISKDEFSLMQNDSRVFDDYFLFDPNLRNSLKKIKIEYEKSKPNFKTIKTLSVAHIENLIKNLFLGKKVAIADIRKVDLIQNILATLPPSLRLVSFSTLVVNPERQSEYEFIQIPENLTIKLKRGWKVIEPQTKITRREGSDEKHWFEFFSRLILDENERMLQNLHEEYQELPGHDPYNKISFLFYKNLSQSTRNLTEKANYTYQCAATAQKFDLKLADEYLRKAKDYSVEANSKELLLKIEIGELALLLHTNPLSLKLIEKILDRLGEVDPEVRFVLLNKIVKKKKKEFKENGYSLLRDTVSSISYYKNDILRLFIENKSLTHHIPHLLREIDDYDKRLDLIEFLVDTSLRYNPNSLKHLFVLLDMPWKRSILKKLKNIIYDIFSRQIITANNNHEILIPIAKNIRRSIEDALAERTTTDSTKEELEWKSKEDFDDFKYILDDIVHTLLSFFENLMSTKKKELNNDFKSLLSQEISRLESLAQKLHSVRYGKKPKAEYRPPTIFDYFTWWWR